MTKCIVNVPFAKNCADNLKLTSLIFIRRCYSLKNVMIICFSVLCFSLVLAVLTVSIGCAFCSNDERRVQMIKI